MHTLNEEQKSAVEHTLGPVLVVAGAGTGKTKTLTSRIIHLIRGGVAPEQILAITFTNKAAGEMRERVEGEMREYETRPCIRTFHGLSAMLLRNEHEHAELARHFAILDQSDSRALIKTAMDNLDYDTKRWEPRKIQSIISRAKGKGLVPSDFGGQVKNQIEEVSTIIWKEYEKLKSAEQACDFDDLLARAYFLLEKNKVVREKYQNLWHYIHIDEYQDTNDTQYKLAKILSAPQHNLFAVGDSDQNIYSWRGANIENILHFERDFPKGKVFVLRKNYRSTKNILAAADSVISKNKHRIPKELEATIPEGEKLSLYVAFSENDEAQFVANRAAELMREGVSPDEIAVLYRTNFQSRVLEEAFLYAGVPYELVGTKFFERAEVKDAIAYLRVSLNRDNLTDLKRTINNPKRGLGQVAITKIFSGQADALPAKQREAYDQFTRTLDRIEHFALENAPHQTMKYIIKESGLENMYSDMGDEGLERLANLKELVTFAKKYEAFPHDEALEKFLEDIALMSDQDEIGVRSDKKESRAKLMTIHAAKGLEFEYIFITGLEQGLFPSERNEKESKYEEEEERRLCYVAITRGKKKVFLSYAQMRTIYGNREINELSEFIADIPDELLEWEESEWGGGDGGDEGERVVYLDF